jgi:predicted PurR-regulated permease PerM
MSQLPDFFARTQAKVMAFLEAHPDLNQWVSQNIDLQAFDWSAILEKVAEFVSSGVGTIITGAIAAVKDIFGVVFNLVISVVFSFYCLACKETLARQARRLAYCLLKEQTADFLIRVLRMSNSTFSNFVTGQCLEAVILGLMFVPTMAIFRMPYIPLITVLITVTALVPLVGAFAGCIFGAFFILVTDPMLAVGFVIMFLVIQQIEGNLIYPRVVGESIGLPGMWVLLAVAVGGGTMGVAGMFLMIPLSSVVYTLLREVTGKKLESRGIDAAKLEVQPPELRSRLKKHVEHIRKKKKDKSVRKTKGKVQD